MGPSSRCPDARGSLPQYVEGELSPLESRRIQGHLALCEACRREETEYRAAIGALRAPRALSAHRDLYPGFAAKVARFDRRPAARPLQIRWAAGALAVLVVAGASAAYIRSMVAPQDAVAKTSTPGPVDAAALAHSASARPAAKAPGMSLAATHGTTTPANGGMKDNSPDPFDPSRVAQASPDSAPRTVESPTAGASEAVRRNRRLRSLARNDDFLRVKPVQGPTAEEIIVQKRREITVAQYGAPQTTEAFLPNGRDDQPSARPIVVAADPDQKTPPGADSKKPVALSMVDDSEVMVNGKKTDVQSSVGFDKHGRPVLIKVNIGPRPATDKSDLDR